MSYLSVQTSKQTPKISMKFLLVTTVQYLSTLHKLVFLNIYLLSNSYKHDMYTIHQVFAHSESIEHMAN